MRSMDPAGICGPVCVCVLLSKEEKMSVKPEREMSEHVQHYLSAVR